MVRTAKVFFDLFVIAVFLVLNGAEPQAGEARGKIKSLSADKGQLVLAEEGGAAKTFHLDEDCKVSINNRKAVLADLQVGEQVTVVHTRQGEKFLASEIKCKRD